MLLVFYEGRDKCGWRAIDEQFHGQLSKATKQYDTYCVLLALYAEGCVIFCVNLPTGGSSPLHYHNTRS